MMTIQKLNRLYDTRRGENWNDEHKAWHSEYMTAQKQCLADYGWGSDMKNLICPWCGSGFDGSTGWAIAHTENHLEVKKHKVKQMVLL